jgi:hypothetical protein
MLASSWEEAESKCGLNEFVVGTLEVEIPIGDN